MNNLALLDSRLKRIEELLGAVAPVLEQQLRAGAPKKLAGQKRALEQSEDSQSFSEGEGEGITQSDDEEDDYDDEEGEVEDEEGNFLDEAASNESMKGESEDSDAPGAELSRESKKSTQSKHSKGSKTPKKTASVNLTLDVPSDMAQTTSSFVGYGDSINQFENNEPDLINSTILNSSDNIFFGDTPFFFCTTAGLKWIADKTNEPMLVDRFEASFKHAHTAHFNLFRKSVEECGTAEPIPPKVLAVSISVFKACISSYEFFTHSEVDAIVAGELDPKSGKNGFAEKLALHSMVALSLICLHENEELKGGAELEVTMAMIQRQIHNAYHYFFRFSLIGNSITGVRAIVLLLICLLYTGCHAPPLMVSAVGVRLAQEIGLHLKQFSVKLPRVEAERRNRLWWILYSLEKDITIRYGKPSTIIDESITTHLPTYMIEFDEGLDYDRFCFAKSTAQLYRLWSRVCIMIYTFTSSRVSVKDKVIKLVNFDKELAAWRESIPAALQPGADVDPYATLDHLTLHQAWKIKFSIVHAHTMYYFVLLSIHRQIAYHPSWIYKVPGDRDQHSASPVSNKASPFNDSDSETTPRTLSSVVDNYIANKFQTDVNSKNLPTSHMSYVERHNNVKLIAKRIAIENPRLLLSFHISVECSRKTIIVINARRGSSMSSFSLSFFLLNAFITLLIKCFMQPNDSETPRDLEIMRMTTDWVERNSFFTEQLLKDTKQSFLHVLLEAICNYVARKRASTSSMAKPEGESAPARMSTDGSGSNGAAPVPPVTESGRPNTRFQAARYSSSLPFTYSVSPGMSAGLDSPLSAYGSVTAGSNNSVSNTINGGGGANTTAAGAPMYNGADFGFNIQPTGNQGFTSGGAGGGEESAGGVNNTNNTNGAAETLPMPLPAGSANPMAVMFDDLFVDPITADPQLFDSLYQLSSHWGSWESTELWTT